MSSFQKIYVYGEDYFINSLREHKEFFKLEFDKIDSFKKRVKTKNIGICTEFINKLNILNEKNSKKFSARIIH